MGELRLGELELELAHALLGTAQDRIYSVLQRVGRGTVGAAGVPVATARLLHVARALVTLGDLCLCEIQQGERRLEIEIYMCVVQAIVRER